MVAIVEDLVRRILRNGEPVGDGGEMVQNLLKQGYALEDIQKAFAWIFSDEEIISGEAQVEQLYEGWRIFSPVEEKKLSVAFRSMMQYWTSTGQISKSEAEKIFLEAINLERAEIDVVELQHILPHVIKDSNRLLLLLPRTDEGEHMLH